MADEQFEGLLQNLMSGDNAVRSPAEVNGKRLPVSTVVDIYDSDVYSWQSWGGIYSSNVSGLAFLVPSECAPRVFTCLTHTAVVAFLIFCVYPTTATSFQLIGYVLVYLKQLWRLM